MSGGSGAWKVAYADFVTAMMALFMVLWISAQDEHIQLATSQYFQNPFNATADATSGVIPSNKSSRSQGQKSGSGNEQDKKNQVELTFLNSVAADFYRLLHIEQDVTDKPIEIQITTDGLRITLFDRVKQPLFLKDTAELTEWGRFVMQNLAWMIDRHNFRVTIDGHTRTREAPVKENYSNWELAADRANTSRRSLVHYAVDTELIERITGYADTRPLPGEPPESERHERLTLSLTLAKVRFKDNKLVDGPVPIVASEKESASP